MSTIIVQDIERNPAAFLAGIEAVEYFLVVAAERTLAEVRSVPSQPIRERPFGLCAGQFTIPADFDEQFSPMFQKAAFTVLAAKSRHGSLDSVLGSAICGNV
jgi:hypothetical protein